MINKKSLNDFINLNDLPPIDKYKGGHIEALYFLKIYSAILKKGGGRELMAKYIGRKPMSVKKKLKSIIKEYNKRQLWHNHFGLVVIKDIAHLEEGLLNSTLEY